MREMTDDEVNKKHRRVRGSDALKYPPNESRCRETCGTRHDRVVTAHGERMVEHRCFLALEHQGYCEVSSACGSIEVPKKSLAA